MPKTLEDWKALDPRQFEVEWEGLWNGYLALDDRKQAIKQANAYRESIGIRKLSRKEKESLFPFPEN